LPLDVGRDKWPVDRIEFASFAMLAMPIHRLGPGDYATGLGDVADFRVGSLPARNSSPNPIFENIFLPPSDPRLTSNSQTAKFDSLTRRC
jgi:hypothetical protein